MTSMAEQRKAALDHLGTDPLHMREATVAIVRANGPCLAQLGTGSLFTIAGRYFVVTAGHVVIEAHRMKASLGISCAARGFVATPGPWIVSKNIRGGTVEDSMIDIALYELNPDQRTRLGANEFLKLSDVALDDSWPAATFVLFGFPQMLCDSATEEGQLVGLGAMKIMTGLSRASKAALERFDANVHILLDATDNGIFDEDGADTALRSRSPYPIPVALASGLKGISGCPVWRLSRRGQGRRRVAPDDWRLVGVQTALYQQRKAIKVTRWGAVVELIRSSYPDTAPAMRLFLPRLK